MTRASDIASALISALLLCLVALPARAASDGDDADPSPLRPTLSMFTLDVGYASIHDSYLTPVTYSGLDLAVGYEAMRAAWFNPHQWLWQLSTTVDYNYTDNPAGNNSMHLLAGDVTADVQRRWRNVRSTGLDLSAGPMAQLRAGLVYNPANSNNTVSVIARASVGVTGMATYNTRLARRLPVTLRYQAALPVLGVFFAPDYDESYYEIYLGNRHNLAHLGWWGNRLDMTHYLGADLHLGSTIVRLGYRCRLERSWQDGLHVHNVGHSLVVGIGGEFLGLSRKPQLRDREIVSPLY